MGRRRTWTMAELQQAKNRAESGETWATIAEDFGIQPGTVRKQVRTHLGGVQSRAPRMGPPEYVKKIRDAVVIRNTEFASWSIIAERIDWHASRQALRKAVDRYAEIHGLTVKKGFPAERRTKWGTSEGGTHD